jgi:hypothetical protein
LNQHYLDSLFPLREGRVVEDGGIEKWVVRNGCAGDKEVDGVGCGRRKEGENRVVGKKALGVRECSRLWGYRDGRVPGE